ncbi:hypothetical protein AAC387_Pa06g1884 [Persea americana]
MAHAPHAYKKCPMSMSQKAETKKPSSSCFDLSRTDSPFLECVFLRRHEAISRASRRTCTSLMIFRLQVKMAGKSNRGKNRGRALIDNSKVVADANGVQQSNLGDKLSGVDESTSAKSEVVDTIKQPQATNPNRWKIGFILGDSHDVAWG